MTYPPGWPRCPNCNDYALDGHITCGRVECNESKSRRERTKSKQAIAELLRWLESTARQTRTPDEIRLDDEAERREHYLAQGSNYNRNGWGQS